MLVLKRLRDESILIFLDGRTVEVKVLGYEGREVRLGITAPKDVLISRKELVKSEPFVREVAK